MAIFGSFETEREISSTPEAVVFTARKVGEPGALRYALKLFPPPPAEESLSLLEGPRPAGPGWEDTAAQRIELQKRAAAASPLIVPILESGRDERGVWCVTRLYPHSVQMLLAGGVALNREAIHRILRAIARAALACKQHCGRGHGAIKPSNIMLGSAELKQAEIGLSDPAPGAADDTARIELADLRGLGLVLVQLVRRRELADTADWLVQRIEMSAPWSGVFGRSAGDWLALCNRLLDPALSLDGFDLDKLDAALAALEPKPAVSRRAWAAAGAVAVLAAAGVMLLAWLRSRGTLEITINVPDAQVTVSRARGETVSKPAQQKAPLKLRLAADDYEIVGRAGDLMPVTNQVTLVGGTRTTNRLEFVYGSFTVQSPIPGALVRFTNDTEAPLPYSSNYARPGEIKLQVRKDGFIPADLAGVVVPGKPLLLQTNLERLPDNTVLVRLVSYPEGARFFRDGQPVDRRRIALPYGKHLLTARYHHWKQEVTQPLEVSGQTRELEVEFRFQSTKVTFDSQLSNVTMSVNGIRYTNHVVPPPYTNSFVPSVPNYDFFEPGKTFFSFEASGYKTSPPIERDLVAGQPTNILVNLEPLGGLITLTSDPPGATLWTNGVRTAGPNGQTPATLVLPAGDYDIRATYGGLGEKRLERLGVTNGMELSWNFHFDFGEVRFAADPARGTEFFWMSNSLRTAVPSPPYFAPGEHTFVATNSLYPLTDVVTRAFVVPSLTNLLMRFNYASVIVTSVPPTGPQVWAGANLLGQVPWTNPIVPFGTQQYTLKLSRKPDYVLKVPINATGTFTFSHNFERLPPVTNMLGMRFEFIPDQRIFVSRYETTVGELLRVLPTNAVAMAASLDPNLPARQVKWKDAQDFCQTLEANETLGDFKPAELNQPVNRKDYVYSIPTEEEWNSYQSDIPANAVLAGRLPKPVGGGSAANRFGLFDVYGNVAEYCTGSDQKTWLLGGSFLSSFSRSSPYRRIAGSGETNAPGYAGSDVGFRVILRPRP